MTFRVHACLIFSVALAYKLIYSFLPVKTQYLHAGVQCELKVNAFLLNISDQRFVIAETFGHSH